MSINITSPITLYFVIRINDDGTCRPLVIRTSLCGAKISLKDFQTNFKGIQFTILPLVYNDNSTLWNEVQENLKSLLK